MGIDRQRIRIGRTVTYSPTDAEATAGGGAAGDLWPALITYVNPDGMVNIIAFRPSGTTLAKTSIALGAAKGTYSTRGIAAAA